MRRDWAITTLQRHGHEVMKASDLDGTMIAGREVLKLLRAERARTRRMVRELRAGWTGDKEEYDPYYGGYCCALDDLLARLGGR